VPKNRSVQRFLNWRTSGAGGYGDAWSRDPLRVVFNVEEGLVSPRAAHDIYGVVIDPVTLAYDAVATEMLRGRNQRPTVWAPWPAANRDPAPATHVT
jgi:hypothetical protein